MADPHQASHLPDSNSESSFSHSSSSLSLSNPNDNADSMRRINLSPIPQDPDQSLMEEQQVESELDVSVSDDTSDSEYPLHARPYDPGFERHALSMISERTEGSAYTRSSIFGGGGIMGTLGLALGGGHTRGGSVSSPTSDIFRRPASVHSRASTDPGSELPPRPTAPAPVFSPPTTSDTATPERGAPRSLRHTGSAVSSNALTPGRRAGDLIAMFEGKAGSDRSSGSSTSSFGSIRPSPLAPGAALHSRVSSSDDKSEKRSSSGSSSSSSYGQVRSSTLTSAFPQTSGYTSSQSMPTASRTGGESPFPRSITSPMYDFTLDTLSSSRPPSPTKTFTQTQTSPTRSTFMSPPPPLPPNSPAHTPTRTPTSTRPSTPTASTAPLTPLTPSFPRPATARRSPLSSVRNIVAAWKDRSPSSGKKDGKEGKETRERKEERKVSDGLFSIRRRQAFIPGAADPFLQTRPESPKYSDNPPPYQARRFASNGNGEKGSEKERESSESRDSKTIRERISGVAPSINVSDFGSQHRTDQEPLRIGILWYLNVHLPPPYRWIRARAILYPNALILSWVQAGGGRAVITLDLLNCTEVRSVPSPTHRDASDDIGSISARAMSGEPGGGWRDVVGFGGSGAGGREGERLEDFLCPFQLLYADGLERLGAESARERVRWVGAIWDLLSRASATEPARSASPTPSQRSTSAHSAISMPSASVTSARSRTSHGSRSTQFIPAPDIDTLPSIPSDRSSSIGSVSSRHDSRSRLLPLRASDDASISSFGLPLPTSTSHSEGARIIAPSRSSSIRRTSSLADLDREFASAVSRASAGTGPAVGVGGPVSVSSGAVGRESIMFSPPPRSRSGTPASHLRSIRTDDRDLTTAPSDTFTRGLTSSGAPYSLVSPTSDTYIFDSTLSPSRRTASASFDIGYESSVSQASVSLTDVSGSSGERLARRPLLSPSPESTPGSGSTTGLSRAGGVRRRIPRVRSRSTPSDEFETPREASPRTSGSEYHTASQKLSSSSSSESSRVYTTPLRSSPPPTTEGNGRSYRSGLSSARSRSAGGDRPTTTLTTMTPTERYTTTAPRSDAGSSSTEFDVCVTSSLTGITTTSSYDSPSRSGSVTPSGRSSSHYSKATSSGSSTSQPYITASPYTTSYGTAPSPTPSSTHYFTAGTPGTPSSSKTSRSYNTVPTCVSDTSSSKYVTATPCPSTEYETAEVCPPSEEERAPSTVPTIPSVHTTHLRSPQSTEWISSPYSPSTPQRSLPPIPRTPSTLGEDWLSSPLTLTIPLSLDDQRLTFPASSVSGLTTPFISTEPLRLSSRSSSIPLSTELPSFPSSTALPSTFITSATPSSPVSMTLPTVSSQSISITTPTGDRTVSSVLTPWTLSDAPPPLPPRRTPSAPSTSVPLSPTASEISSTISTPSTISSGLPPPASPAASRHSSLRESLWARESSASYDSSFLNPSPSLPSTPLPEGIDESYNTSFLRPSESVISDRKYEPLLVPSSPSLPEYPPSPSTPKVRPVSVVSSVSTPATDRPSILSQIETVSSATEDAPVTNHHLAGEINRVLDYLEAIDQARGDESRDIGSSIRAIRDELADLNSFLKERPPPVPAKDAAVGRSLLSESSESVRPPLRIEPSMIPIPVTPRLLSPPSSESSMTFISSAHSDMSSLYLPTPPPRIETPPFPSDSSPTSTSIISGSSGTSSPTLSTATARPGLNLNTLRDLLLRLQEQHLHLLDGQRHTQQLLEDLANRPPPIHLPEGVADDATRQAALRGVEGLLHRIIDALAPPSVKTASEEGSDSALEQQLLDKKWQQLNRSPIEQPQPRKSPSSVDFKQWETYDLPADSQRPTDVAPPTIPAIRTIEVPHPKRRRARSVSPTITVPPEGDAFSTTGRPIFEQGTTRMGEPSEQADQPATGVPEATPTEGPEYDFLKLVQAHRRQRRGDGSDGIYYPSGPSRPQPPAGPVVPNLYADERRPPTAPPDLGAEARSPVTGTWYSSRRPPHEQQPTTFGDAPAQATSIETPIFIPTAPPGEGAPPYQEILDLLRENRLANANNSASFRGLEDHLGRLRLWLEADQRDRQYAMRHISERIWALHTQLTRVHPGLAEAAPLGYGPAPFPQSQPAIVIPGSPRRSPERVIPEFDRFDPRVVIPNVPGGPGIVPQFSTNFPPTDGGVFLPGGPGGPAPVFLGPGGIPTGGPGFPFHGAGFGPQFGPGMSGQPVLIPQGPQGIFIPQGPFQDGQPVVIPPPGAGMPGGVPGGITVIQPSTVPGDQGGHVIVPPAAPTYVHDTGTHRPESPSRRSDSPRSSHHIHIHQPPTSEARPISPRDEGHHAAPAPAPPPQQVHFADAPQQGPVYLQPQPQSVMQPQPMQPQIIRVGPDPSYAQEPIVIREGSPSRHTERPIVIREGSPSYRGRDEPTVIRVDEGRRRSRSRSRSPEIVHIPSSRGREHEHRDRPTVIVGDPSRRRSRSRSRSPDTPRVVHVADRGYEREHHRHHEATPTVIVGDQSRRRRSRSRSRSRSHSPRVVHVEGSRDYPREHHRDHGHHEPATVIVGDQGHTRRRSRSRSRSRSPQRVVIAGSQPHGHGGHGYEGDAARTIIVGDQGHTRRGSPDIIRVGSPTIREHGGGHRIVREGSPGYDRDAGTRRRSISPRRRRDDYSPRRHRDDYSPRRHRDDYSPRRHRDDDAGSPRARRRRSTSRDDYSPSRRERRRHSASPSRRDRDEADGGSSRRQRRRESPREQSPSPRHREPTILEVHREPTIIEGDPRGPHEAPHALHRRPSYEDSRAFRSEREEPQVIRIRSPGGTERAPTVIRVPSAPRSQVPFDLRSQAPFEPIQPLPHGFPPEQERGPPEIVRLASPTRPPPQVIRIATPATRSERDGTHLHIHSLPQAGGPPSILAPEHSRATPSGRVTFAPRPESVEEGDLAAVGEEPEFDATRLAGDQDIIRAGTPRSQMRDQIRRARGEEPIVPTIGSPSRSVLPSIMGESTRHSPTPSRRTPLRPRDEFEGASFRPPSTQADEGQPLSPVPRRQGLSDVQALESAAGHFGTGEEARRAASIAAEERRSDMAMRAAEEEARRQAEFEAHEAERQRVFEDNERLRFEEADRRRHRIAEEAEQQRSEVAASHEEARAKLDDAVRESIHASLAAAEKASEVAMTDHASVLSLSDLLAKEREGKQASEAEAARLSRSIEEDRGVQLEEQRERIRVLEEELARCHEECEQMKQAQAEEKENCCEKLRVESAERHEEVQRTLGDLTNTLQDRLNDDQKRRELDDLRWDEKKARRADKEERSQALHDLVNSIITEREEEKKRQEEERAAEAARRRVEDVVEELLGRHHAEQSSSFLEWAQTLRGEIEKGHADTIDAVKSTANEQIPFNVQTYLDDFSKALSSEVRMLLKEVGKLREERRALQHEMAYLLGMKSKYGPGGEFDPEWQPPTFPSSGGPMAPPPPPPPPTAGLGPEDVRPAWRSVPQPPQKRKSKKEQQREAQAAGAPPPPVIPEHPTSWVSWKPNPLLVPSPPPTEDAPNVVVHTERIPGLFGPRESPTNSQAWLQNR